MPSALTNLLAQAVGKAGDPASRERAFDELSRLVMIYVRASMGRRLRDQRESMDVCQSVAKSFIDDFDQGRIRFDSEAQLAAYLQQIVKSKVTDLARADGAAKRGGDARPISLTPADQSVSVEPAARGPSASTDMRTDEALDRLLDDLSPEEKALARLRAQGLSWEQISAHLNEDVAALRQRYSRVARRIEGGITDA